MNKKYLHVLEEGWGGGVQTFCGTDGLDNSKI